MSDSMHDGHWVTYRQETLMQYEINSVDDESGHIFVSFSDGQPEDAFDSHLYCNTCKVRVEGPEIGAPEDWEVEFV